MRNMTAGSIRVCMMEKGGDKLAHYLQAREPNKNLQL